MRDTIKTKDYFLERIQEDTARIKKFETILNNTDPSNERGIRLGKGQLSKLYWDCAKAAYSMGANLEEMYSCYFQSINYYKDVCTPVDSQYDIIDFLSVGVLFQKRKLEFLSALETIVEKANSQDGLICCLLQFLQGKPLEFQQSKLNYFNQLTKSDDKAGILSVELSQWYQHHKGAYWYNSHNSKNNTYRGYWCFEIAALSKIFEIDDGQFASNPYYPNDLAHGSLSDIRGTRN